MKQMAAKATRVEMNDGTERTITTIEEHGELLHFVVDKAVSPAAVGFPASVRLLP
jgi:hypothetical protein